ncbi:hypothetical protein ACFWPU_01610 [Streptomyces sp. NPDC058471]|uniref:hypothetical protein n=1 Tax=Streptomyces sp. NPDC058471 TaxID=3346516 RepID=UPI0036462044
MQLRSVCEGAAGCALVLLRLAYSTVTILFGALRLLPVSDRDKVTEVLALRHQLPSLSDNSARTG